MGKFATAVRVWFAAHRKVVTAVGGIGVIVVDDVVTGTAVNWQTIIISVLAALGVYAVPNAQPPMPTT